MFYGCVRVLGRCKLKTMITEDEIEDDYVYTIDILYGPTNVCGAVKHRTGRIDHVKGKVEDVKT